jgi:hypothetical protein
VCEVELPASYIVWACSKEAEFIKGKFVWVHWDVNELRTVLRETMDRQIFTTMVNGMPNISL